MKYKRLKRNKSKRSGFFVDMKIDYLCVMCCKEFKSLHELKLHTFSNHICFECKKYFIFVHQYENHRNDVHHKSYVCKLCPKLKLSCKSQQISHLNLAHYTGMMKVGCSEKVCLLKVDSSSSINYHIPKIGTMEHLGDNMIIAIIKHFQQFKSVPENKIATFKVILNRRPSLIDQDEDVDHPLVSGELN